MCYNFLFSCLSRPRRLSGQGPSICWRRPLACLKAPPGLSLPCNRRAAPNTFSRERPRRENVLFNKNKTSAEDTQSETEGIQIVKSPERGRTSDNSSPARPTGSDDPVPAVSPRSAAAGGAHPLQRRAAS